VRRALESQRPAWTPGAAQGYHAITFGLYASALFEAIAGEPLGPFLRRELLEPLASDAWLGTPASEDERVARLYPPQPAERVRGLAKAVLRREWTEPRIVRALLQRRSLLRRAFLNPRGDGGVTEYNRVPLRRAELAWASATASARGLARAYLPFASGGTVDGRAYLKPSTLAPLHARQSWSERDLVLQKPIGWSQGFVKEQTTLFSPNPESFGHPGMGGALGWCDPMAGIAVGYVMNRMDWRVRSPRAVALCRALYACEAVSGATSGRSPS
jgi:CubicO group peptidase (beta-lactamase class C family)